MADEPKIRAIATNRRARHNYFIEETYEAGIALVGSEVKTLRGGKASLQDAYAMIKGSEIFLLGVHIPPYPQASIQNHEPTRMRKLLLHKEEIKRLIGKMNEKGLTLVPLSLYFKGNKVKAELALAKGKKAYDKRQSIAEREARREMARRVGSRKRGERR